MDTTTTEVAPVTALGLVCTHDGDSYGLCVWSCAGALRVLVTQDAQQWCVSAHASGLRSITLAYGMGATLAEAEADCEREWTVLLAAIAARPRSACGDTCMCVRCCGQRPTVADRGTL